MGGLTAAGLPPAMVSCWTSCSRRCSTAATQGQCRACDMRWAGRRAISPTMPAVPRGPASGGGCDGPRRRGPPCCGQARWAVADGGTLFAFSSFVMGALASLPAAQGVAAIAGDQSPHPASPFMPVSSQRTGRPGAHDHGIRLGDRGRQPRPRAGALLVVGLFGCHGRSQRPAQQHPPARRCESAEAVAAWRHYRRAWTRWNHLRTVAALAACVHCIAGLRAGESLRRPRIGPLLDRKASRCSSRIGDQGAHRHGSAGRGVGDQEDVDRRRAPRRAAAARPAVGDVTLHHMDRQRPDAETGHDHPPDLLQWLEVPDDPVLYRLLRAQESHRPQRVRSAGRS